MAAIHTVDALQLAQWLADDEAVLVDVREVVEYQSERIEQARNLPLSQVNIDEAHLPAHRHKKLVIHCKSGRRSMLACEHLLQQNASYDVWNLEGGIVAWKQAQLPVKSGARKVLPLDQQVQVAIGIFILIGMALGYFVHTAWLILPVIIGLGLINAGVSGSCMLASVMAKMPWNRS